MSAPVFRFAPSPNGYLHLGHAYSALWTAQWAGRLGGRFLLRIEDIDRARSKPEFTAAIFEDLEWLGLEWDDPVLRQSECFADYAVAAEMLRRRQLLYPCFCSRAEIAAHAGARDPDDAPIYPGTCRHLSPEVRASRLAAGEPVQWRLDLERALEEMHDLTYKLAMPDPGVPPIATSAEPRRWGDVVLVRKDTPTSYHLSVVIDDAAQGITQVTRGRDMEAATDIHVLLQRLLELPTPTYSFHELLLGPDGRKLSKSKGSESLRSLREKGWAPDDVRRVVGLDDAAGPGG